MTVPGPETIPAQAPDIIVPEDQHSRFGWTHSHHLPGTPLWVDLHKSGTAVGSLLLSTAATALTYTAHGHSFEQTDISWHTTSTSKHTEVREVTDGPQTITTHRTVTKTEPGKPQTLHYSVSAANMPDVHSFDLSTTPEAQVIVNQSSFSTFIDRLVTNVKEGYSIDNLDVSGVASDETELNARAGIGKIDPENLSLAKQYQDFVHTAMLHALKKHGITVPAKDQHGKPHEAVLTGDDLAYFNQIRHDGHFKSNLDLIEAFKSKHGLSDADAEGFLNEVLKQNRGANISVHLVSAAGQAITKVYNVTTERCLTTTTQYETTASKIEHHHPSIPLVLLPLPIVRVRRQRRPGQPETAAEPEGTPEPEAPLDPAEQEIIDRYGDFREAERGRFRLSPSARPRIISEIELVRRRQESRRLYGEDIFGDTDQYENRLARLMSRLGVNSLDGLERLVSRPIRMPGRLGRILLTGALGAGTLFFLSTIRGDAGYCPDPQDHSKQSWHASDFLPDYLRLRLEIPFTDVHTNWSGDVLPTYCPPKGGGNPAGPTYVPSPEPTCDTRTITIVNGVPKGKPVETHYPGATHTTTTQIR